MSEVRIAQLIAKLVRIVKGRQPNDPAVGVAYDLQLEWDKHTGKFARDQEKE